MTTAVSPTTEEALKAGKAQWWRAPGRYWRALREEREEQIFLVLTLLIGALAFLVARGAHAEVDQKGALAQVIAKPYGGWLVGLVAVGFGCYALWRLSEAVPLAEARYLRV